MAQITQTHARRPVQKLNERNTREKTDERAERRRGRHVLVGRLSISARRAFGQPRWHYGAAILLVLAATALRLAFLHALGMRAPFLMFYPAVILSALYWGARPALLATLLSGILAGLWMEPAGQLSPSDAGDWLSLGLFWANCALLCSVAGVIKRAQARAHRAEARAQLAAERERGEQRLRRVVENISDAVIVDDVAGHIVFANDQFLSLYGRSRDELPHLRLEDYVAPEFRAALRDRHDRRIRGEQVPTRFEYQGLRKDGGRIWAEVIVVPVHDETGRITGTQSCIRDVTERKAAQEALQESERRERERAAELATLLDAVPTPVIIIGDPNSRGVTGNRAADELLRRPHGAGITAVACGEKKPPRFKAIKDGRELSFDELPGRVAARGIAVRDFEFSLVFDDGTRRDVLGYGTPLRDEQGQPRGGIAVLVDVTERKRAEEALQRERDLLQAVMKGAKNSHLVYLDRDFNFVRVNQAYAATCGYKPEELIGKNHFALYPHAENEAIFARVRDTGEPFEVHDSPFVFPDQPRRGVTYWDWSLTPVRDTKGEVAGLVFSLFETTERKRAEEALRVKEELARAQAAQLQAVLDSAPAVIWIAHDRQCRSVSGNRAALEFSRVPESSPTKAGPAPVHLRPWRVFQNGVELQPHEMPIERVAASGKPLTDCAIDFHFDDGTVRSLLGNVMPTHDREGQPIGAIAAFIDVTELRELQVEHEALLNSERAARSEAEHASRMKDEFIAVLSHELRNPLNAILGWVHILRRSRRSPEDVEQALDVIEKSGHTLKDMITDLLDMSRITGGKLRLYIQAVDLRPIVAAAVDAVRAAADEKGVSLKVVCDDGIGCVRGDPNRLQQITWNLLANALKFTDAGGAVRVEATRTASQVEIKVSDTGQGIDLEFLPQVFERFRQEDASMSRKHGGLGLGLSIVRSLVALHGGTVTAESAGKGRGTTFTVTLPALALPEAEETRGTLTAAVEPFTACANATLDGVKVLVVDDEPEALNIAERILEGHFAQVFTARCAREGMEMLQRVRPDVLVSDIGMPEEDGFQFLRRVRALGPECGGATPAVALTAYAGLEDCQRAMVCGYQVHLPKPIDAAQLIATVAGLVGRWALGPGAHTATRSDQA